ncbi:hypothetical protein CJ218_04985 [Gemella sanguinis]|uniref:DUF1310 domain-containing protein n=1 Tax=Gemella sanguinis TaxID=84135 RepID=A0A2N6SEZ6_9BACL|nr:hypothetical protein CJ218_04985 [Gemella sanguinis]
MLKKVLKGTLIVILLIIGSAGLILGKEYIERKRIEHIVKSGDGKEAIENMLKKMDSKALTSEGKIKTYKIDFDQVEKNLMGGINIYLTINDDPDMILHTTLVRGTRGEKYKTGAIVISPKLSKFID